MSNIQKVSDVKSLFQNQAVQKRIKELLGNNSKSFMTSVIQISQSNDMLKNADPNSILGAALTATTLDLPLNNSLGFAYIVPFYDSKTKTTKAQFQIGAKGFKQLAIRSGQFKTIHTTDVREGEIKNNNRLTGVMDFEFIADDQERESKKIIGYVSYFELTNGFSSTFYMTVNEIEKHAKQYSQTYKKGFGNWKDNFDAMAKKTVTKMNLSKNAPLSVEMQKATTYDQAVINEKDEVSYNDNDTYAEVIEDKPLLSESQFAAALENIKTGDIELHQVTEMYNLTDIQLNTLEGLSNE